jgi:hypothetical protein
MQLEQPEKVAAVLRSLVESSHQLSTLVAYQVSFDLVDNATQHFLQKVMDALPKASVAPTPAPATPQQATGGDAMAVDTQAGEFIIVALILCILVGGGGGLFGGVI